MMVYIFGPVPIVCTFWP